MYNISHNKRRGINGTNKNNYCITLNHYSIYFYPFHLLAPFKYSCIMYAHTHFLLLFDLHNYYLHQLSGYHNQNFQPCKYSHRCDHCSHFYRRRLWFDLYICDYCIYTCHHNSRFSPSFHNNRTLCQV